MSDSSSNSNGGSTPSSQWKLPDGIEDDIEQALIKTAVGATVGGLLGVIMFRSGGGSRAASVAAGVGVAAGSTFERIAAKIKTEQQA
ncbi:protein of unknown function DUF543 containing protein [Nitzschia inconspicua]|uniref:Uncharacterized protein n=1 Tax=Nitzschia inconspicua TaxID=303405 RepID=A0A9K3L8R1_9STRA|nr:protein of unknown function DUF543 containing protein [Nitzschia inconspicua]